MSGILSAIKAVFSADTAPLKRGVDDSKKALNNLKSEGGGAITDMAARIGIDMKGIQDTFGTINKISGSLALGFKGATTASTGLSGAMKVLKLALVSTGIGAIVVVLGALVSYFMKTKRGSDELSQALKAFGAVISVLIDRASAFGEAIIAAFQNPKEAIADAWEFIESQFVNRFTAIPLVIEKAWNLIKSIFNDQSMLDASKEFLSATTQLGTGFDANQQKKVAGYFKGIGEEMSKEAAEAYNLQKRLNELDQKEIEMSVSIAERRAKIQELLAASKEENRSKAEQIRLMEEAKRLIKEVGKEEVDIANERARIVAAFGDLGENLRKDDKEIADSKIAALNKEREIYSQLKEVNSQITGLKNQQLATTKAEYDALRKIILEREKETKLMQPKTFDKKEIDTLTLAPIELKPLDESMTALDQQLKRGEQATQTFVEAQKSLMDTSVANFATGFGEMMGQMMLGNAGIEDFGAMILSTIGGFIAQLGQLIIMAGTSMLGLQSMFADPLNPGAAIAAIAAGALLVAVGTAIQGIGSSASKSSGSSVSASGGGTIDTRQNTSTATQVFGEFKIKGADLVAVIGKENVRRATVS